MISYYLKTLTSAPGILVNISHILSNFHAYCILSCVNTCQNLVNNNDVNALTKQEFFF